MKKKVLLVDDDRLILSSMRKGLSLSGYDVFSALSAEDAISLAVSDQPDVAIVDIRMPGLNGIELARHLILKLNLPVIFLSAYSDEETITEAIDCGCMSYLVKPCSLQQVILTIESVCEKANEIKQLKEHNRHLDNALTQSRDICIAIGLFMHQYDLDQEQAFEKLRQNARSSRRKVSELAREIVLRGEEDG